jgi:predicted nucleic acid-binding protein
MSREFVIDASVVVDVFGLDSKRSDIARKFLAENENYNAPDILIAESFSGLRRMWLRDIFGFQHFARSLTALLALPIELTRSEELVFSALRYRSNISAKDSLYVALASELNCPLITTDVRLSRAPGLRCEVLVLQ